MNIQRKLMIILALPMCLIAFAAYFFATGITHELQDAKKLIAYNHSFLSLSHLIHEVQKERAKSSLFLGKNLSADELKKHRDVVSKAQEEAHKEFMTAGPSASDLQVWDAALNSLADLRGKVDTGIEAPEAAKAFGQIVDKFILIQLSFSRSVQFHSMQDRLLSLALLTTAKEYAGRLRANVINLLTKNQPLTPVQLVTVNNLKGGVVSNMESKALILSAKGFQAVNAFKENADWKEVNNVIERVIEKSLEGNFGKNPNDFYKSITAAIDAFLVITDAESKVFDEELNIKVAELKSKMILIFSVGGLALLIVIILMGVVVRQLISQLKQIMERLNLISIDLEKVGSKATGSSSSLSSGTSEAAASLEETVASVEELLSMVKANSDNAAEASKLSQGGAEKAAEGEKATVELVRSMRDISESSNKIKDIVSVIDDIAFQINLLALNAAVEAARAGEQGRGFAVVADAVRALAQKSAVAAKDINGLIAESVDKIHRGSEVASKSSDYLNALAEIIKRISYLNQEIANASKEQSAGFGQISQAMNQIDSSTQTNAGAAEEVAQISGEMSRHAEDLGAVVEDLSRFVIGKQPS